MMAKVEDMYRMADEYGFAIDEFYDCPIQGVLIVYSRPLIKGETWMGLEIIGPEGNRDRQVYEVIERNYCPGDADDSILDETMQRAAQHVMWQMESCGRI